MGDNKLTIRVYFVDDSFKTLGVPDSISASELCKQVAEKISLLQLETFSLFYDKNGESRCLDNEEQPFKVIVQEICGPEVEYEKYFEKNEWEKLKKEWEKDSRLVFKRRVFLKHKSIAKEDEIFLHYSYIQAVANVRDGTYPCNEAAAMELAGLQMQVTFNDHNKKIHVQGFLK
jgi:hypothetical protein